MLGGDAASRQLRTKDCRPWPDAQNTPQAESSPLRDWLTLLIDSDSSTILVVDDSRVTLELCAGILESQGYRVETAATGDEALERIARAPGLIDLVLLDLMMPGKNGYQTLQEIRRNYSKDLLPVFVVTAMEGTEDITRAIELGADDFLAKPLNSGLSLPKIAARLRIRSPKRVVRDPQVGDVVGGKYRLEERIGAGGVGTVFRARHLELDSVLAVKLLQDQAFTDGAAKVRLRTEGRALAKLDHPNTVRVWDLVTAEAVPYLVMEFLNGHNLAVEITQRGPMSARLVCRYGAQVAAGLAAAHRVSIQHRDLKPENIFLSWQNQVSCLKLLDFGFAAMADEVKVRRGITADDELVGSPRYIAPERIIGDGRPEKSDIYSLGVVLFEMLSGGQFPYETRSKSIAEAIRAHTGGKVRLFETLGLIVPATLESLVRATLERVPDLRPSAEEVVERLERIGREIREQHAPAVEGETVATPDTEPVDLNLIDSAAPERRATERPSGGRLRSHRE